MNPFYMSRGTGRFEATRSTTGPWHASVQHGGPPAALLMREIERVAGIADGFDWKRVTVEFLRPVPIATVTIRPAPVHQGRKVQMYSATLEADGKVVARANALAVRRLEVQLPEYGVTHAGPKPGPEDSAPEEAAFFLEGMGYHKAMDTRFAVGDFGLGPCVAWFKMRVPLVDGEPPTPIQRVLITADSVSGTSRVLDNKEYAYMNTDLTVHVVRPAVGEWIGIDGETTLGHTGSGLAHSQISDVQGVIGRSLQTLLVQAGRN